MTLQWVAADMLTGAVIADMPGIEPQWPLTRTISDASSATVTLNLDDRTTPQWTRAVLDGGAVLACYDDADSSLPIIWAGVVWQAPRQAEVDNIQLSLSTYESALDHAYVGTVTYATSVARDDIIAALVNNYYRTPTGCTNLQLSYTAGNGTKPAAALAFQNSDNVTVKGRLDQVCAQLGGEYTVEWSWGANQATIVPTLVFADRIGTASQVTFDMPGSLVSFQQDHDYSSDAGARSVTAYSSGQGTTTPYSTPQVGAADGRPAWQFRWQPAANVTSAAVLNQYAKGALAVLTPGKQSITLVASTANPAGRQLGNDWHLGDDVGYSVAASYVNEQAVTVPIRAFPGGVSGVGRVVAYSFDEMTVSPVLADKAVYVQADQS